MSLTRRHLLTSAALLLASLANAAELKLPSIFSDRMVLQSAQAVPVWGSADPGEQIAVEFAGQSKRASANADGKWLVKLDALEAFSNNGLNASQANTFGSPVA